MKEDLSPTIKIKVLLCGLVTRLYCAWLGRQTFFLNLCKVASTVLLFTVNGPSICVVHVVMKVQCDVNSTYKLFVTN